MNFDNKVVYTREQKDFVQQMLNSIPEVNDLWQQNLEKWGKNYEYTFFSELSPFVELTEDALLSDNKNLVKKILNLIEHFLSITNQESRNAIAYFFLKIY